MSVVRIFNLNTFDPNSCSLKAIEDSVEKQKRIHCESIIPFTRFVHNGKLMFIEREYVNGTPLSEIIAQNHSMSEHSAVHILSKIAHMLTYLHENGIVMTSLKPENIIVSLRGGITLVDVGIPAILEDTTLKPMMISNIPYICPERISNSKCEVTKELDIYHFGLLAFQLLTGRMPWTMPNEFKVITEMKNHNIVYPDEISHGFKVLINSCLHPDPLQRPSSNHLLTLIRENIPIIRNEHHVFIPSSHRHSVNDVIKIINNSSSPRSSLKDTNAHIIFPKIRRQGLNLLPMITKNSAV